MLLSYDVGREGDRITSQIQDDDNRRMCATAPINQQIVVGSQGS